MRSSDSAPIPGVDFCVEAREARGSGHDLSSEHVANCSVCLRKQRIAEAKSEGWSPHRADVAATLLGPMARRFQGGLEGDAAEYRGFYAALAADTYLESAFAALVDAELAPAAEPPPGFAARMLAAVRTDLARAKKQRPSVGERTRGAARRMATRAQQAVQSVAGSFPRFEIACPVAFESRFANVNEWSETARGVNCVAYENTRTGDLLVWLDSSDMSLDGEGVRIEAGAVVKEGQMQRIAADRVGIKVVISREERRRLPVGTVLAVGPTHTESA